jgi:transposase
MEKRKYKEGQNRKQGMLLPERVDDYIGKDNVARAVDIYVDSLEIEELGFKKTAGGVQRGQPGYSPKAMLKLYLYGFIQGVRSSRKLARECERNLEVIWIISGLKPSYKAIADFQKNNLGVLKAVNKDFVKICRELDLYGGEFVSTDGSYFRGNVGKKSIYTEKRLKEGLERLEKQIETYPAEMERTDREEVGQEEGIPHLVEKLKKMKIRQKEKQEKLKKLKGSGKTQLAEVDEDSRLLSKNGQSVAGYNVQTAVDGKHKLLVSCAVTQDGNV